MVRSHTYIATPPGATIKEQLLDRGMSQKEFAVRMGMSEKHISKLVNGEVHLTSDVAERLEMVFGIPSSFWNKLEATYREKIEKANEENNMDEEKELAKKFPYREMVELGWIPETRNSTEKVINLRKFFEVANLTYILDERLSFIAWQKMAETEKSKFALLAWVQKVKLNARNIITSPIDINKLGNRISDIRNLTITEPEEFCPKLRSILSESGIAIVFLPHIEGSFLPGASFYDGNKIIIGLTVRGKDADKFWFSLFHELAHIILGHIGQIGKNIPNDEEDADNYAKDKLIPDDDFKLFTEKKDFSVASVISFAQKENVLCGIVVGRLQKEGYIKYSQYNNLKTKYECSDF